MLAQTTEPQSPAVEPLEHSPSGATLSNPALNLPTLPALNAVCAPAALAVTLRNVKHTVAARTTLPALKCVLLNTTLQTDQTDGIGQLSVSTSRLDATSSAWLAARVNSPGSIAVPYDMFAELVARLPQNATLNLEVDAALQILRVRCDDIVTNIKGLAASEFPQPPAWDTGAQIELAGKEFKGLVRQVVYAATVDDSRPVLTGILFELNPNGLAFAAADGFRLSLRALEMGTGLQTTQRVIVPSQVLRDLERIIADDAVVTIAVNANKTHAQFTMPNYRLMVSLIEGNFPDYRQIVPTTHTTRAVVDASAFGAAVDLAMIFAKQSQNLVILDVQPGENENTGLLRITARSAEGGDTVRALTAAVSGPAQRIGLNGKFVKEFVASVSASQIVMQFGTSACPVLFGEVGNSGYKHVLMPMHITK